MKITDAIFTVVCGTAIAWLAYDFLSSYEIDGFYGWLALASLPAVSLICFRLAELIGRKALFVFQAAKYFLVGALVTILDLKIFEFLVWIFPAITSKIISFLLATAIKYWGNKYWAFEKNNRENLGREMAEFLVVTSVGLAIDVGFFFYFSAVLGPQLETPLEIWTKISVISAALAAATWNFLGYKFIVFKK